MPSNAAKFKAPRRERAREHHHSKPGAHASLPSYDESSIFVDSEPIVICEIALPRHERSDIPAVSRRSQRAARYSTNVVGATTTAAATATTTVQIAHSNNPNSSISAHLADSAFPANITKPPTYGLPAVELASAKSAAVKLPAIQPPSDEPAAVEPPVREPPPQTSVVSTVTVEDGGCLYKTDEGTHGKMTELIHCRAKTAVQRNSSSSSDLETALSERFCEKHYVAACQELVRSPTKASLQQLDNNMLTEQVSGDLELVVEQGLTNCARFLAVSDPELAALSRRLVLRHWLVSSTHVRAAYPDIMLKCLAHLEPPLRSHCDAELVSLTRILSQLVEKNALNSSQGRQLFTVATGLIMRQRTTPYMSPISHIIASLIDICVSIFTLTPSGESRTQLAVEIIELWWRGAQSTTEVAYLLVGFLAASACCDMPLGAEARQDMDMKAFKSLALKGIWSASQLSRRLSRILLHDLLFKAKSSEKVHLVTALVTALFKILWDEELAPACLLLTSIAAELTSLMSSDPKGRLDVLVLLLTHFHESGRLLRGPRQNYSPIKAVAAARGTRQIMYVATLQCTYEPTSAAQIYAEALHSIENSTERSLSPPEWREFICKSQLPKCYENVEVLLQKLAATTGLHDSLQIRVLMALTPTIRANPLAYSSFVLSLAGGLTHASLRVCESLVPIAAAVIASRAPESVEILKRVGVRLIMPSSKRYEEQVVEIARLALNLNLEVSKMLFVLLLAILADADALLGEEMSHKARLFLLVDVTSFAAPPTDRVLELLKAVAQSNVLIKFGLRKLFISFTPPASKLLHSWLNWLCAEGNEELICLLSQFGRVNIPRQHLYSSLDAVKSSNPAYASNGLNSVAAALSLESACGSMDPLLSHQIFVKLCEALISGAGYTIAGVNCLSLSIYYVLNNCHPGIRECRQQYLWQVVHAAVNEIENFILPYNSGESQGRQLTESMKDSERGSSLTDMPKLQFREQQVNCESRDMSQRGLERMILLSGCVINWAFINAQDTRRVIKVYIALHSKTSRGDKQSCLLVRTVFSILSRRRLLLEPAQEILAFIDAVVDNQVELDTLIDVLISWEWFDFGKTFSSPLLEHDWFGLGASKQILNRLIESQKVFRDRARFRVVSDCLSRHWLILDHCMPKIISLCFSNDALAAQAGLELCTRLCPLWQPTGTDKVMQGLELASKIEERHAAPFPRVWELITVSCFSRDADVLVDPIQAVMEQVTTSHCFLSFLIQGLMAANLSFKFAQKLQERLAMIITRDKSAEAVSTAKTPRRLRSLEAFEAWLGTRYSERTQDHLRSVDSGDDALDTVVQYSLNRLVRNRYDRDGSKE